MDPLDFSEEEIQQQLALLGYKNIPKHRLLEFKQNLDELIQRGEWRNLVSSPQTPPQPSPPAYTKEKVSSTDGFFLHAATDRDRRTLLTHPNRGDRERQRPRDSYAHHSVAPKLRLAAEAPCRLQEEPAPNLMLNSTLSDSHTSSLDSQERRFIKRKVLRKYQGQRHVCDESFYSEDSEDKAGEGSSAILPSVTSRGQPPGAHVSGLILLAPSSLNPPQTRNSTHLRSLLTANMNKMYKAQEDEDADDKNSLFSSFWSDGEKLEEEEEVEVQRRLEAKPVRDTEEEKIEVKEQEKSGRSLEERSCSDTEDEEEEEEEEEEEGEDLVEEEEEGEDLEEEGEDEEEEGSSDDRNSSYSSFYSDEEDEEEKEVDSKPFGDAEKTKVNDQENQSKDSLDNGSNSDEEEEEDDSSDEKNSSFNSDEDEEEEKEANTKPVRGSEDSAQKNKQEKSRESLEEESHADGEEEEEEEDEKEDEDSSDDRNSSYSSFYSDEEEEVDAKEESSQKTSGEEKSDLNDQENQSRESLEGNHDDTKEEEDEDKNSLYSRFWSDGEKQEEDEDIHFRPVEGPEGFMREISQEEKLQKNLSRGSLKEGGQEESDDEEDEGEKICCSTTDSPTPSLMTSGYGTYRPEEQEGDYRDQDSRGDLSDVRDEDYDQHSLCSAAHTHSSQVSVCVLEQHTATAGGLSARHELVDRPDLISEQEKPEGEKKCGDLCAATVEEHQKAESEDEEKLEESQDVDKMKHVEKEDPDETSSNKDIKFIDSKAGLSWTTVDRMSLEWEGNLRHTDATSYLEERLADLHISPSARPDEEADQSSEHSSDSDTGSLSAFESYVRGLTRTRSDGDLRPKPKSFIRPAVSQQTIKKSDPVAKYFQYKRIWDMFKCPGEVDRRALRWEIKERLAYQPPPPKPRRVYVPNSYIVPTEKKRSALRWEVRTDLANGLQPYKSSCRF